MTDLHIAAETNAPIFTRSQQTTTEKQLRYEVLCEDVTLADLRLLLAAAEAHGLPDDALFDLAVGDVTRVVSLRHRVTTYKEAGA